MKQETKFHQLYQALLAQQILSDMQKEGSLPNSTDERYTPFIGEWNAYKAPEQRFYEFAQKRRELRIAALKLKE